MARHYVDITRQDLESWLDSLPHTLGRAWERVKGREGIYLIHLSDRVGIKLSSTQASTDKAMGRGRASMNLTLVSLVNGHVLNRKARDRKHFQRTLNWRKTWAKGLEYWGKVYKDNSSFYEKIADRDEYRAKWLGIIDGLTMSGGDPKVIKARDKIEEGGVLWDGQEQYLLDLSKFSRKPSNNSLSQPLPIDELRDLYREARRQGNREAMERLKDLGQASGRGELPTLLDLVDFKSFKRELSA